VLHTRAVAKKRTPKLGHPTGSGRVGSRVPYGPPQTDDAAVPAATSGSSGKTVVKVGLAIAAPFVVRAIFRALTR